MIYITLVLNHGDCNSRRPYFFAFPRRLLTRLTPPSVRRILAHIHFTYTSSDRHQPFLRLVSIGDYAGPGILRTPAPNLRLNPPTAPQNRLGQGQLFGRI